MKRLTRYERNNDSCFQVLEKNENNRFYKPNKNCPKHIKVLYMKALARNEDKYLRASQGED